MTILQGNCLQTHSRKFSPGNCLRKFKPSSWLDLVGVFNFLRGGGVLINTFFSFFPSFSGHFQLSHEKQKKATITKQEKITAHLIAGEEVPGLGFHLSSLCPLLPLACPTPRGRKVVLAA